jgi:L-lactate dehydrogenase complex protein LldG
VVATQLADGTSLWSVFTVKAELVGAAVMRTASPGAVATLLHEAATAFALTDKAARRFPALTHEATSASAAPVPDVVSVAEYAVAETGSVALDESAADRVVCFLAERLWILVPEREIVPTLDQGMQRLRDLVRAGARHPLFMTGPSRTADIERVLTIGVHGPRALVIVVVGDA